MPAVAPKFIVAGIRHQNISQNSSQSSCNMNLHGAVISHCEKLPLISVDVELGHLQHVAIRQALAGCARPRKYFQNFGCTLCSFAVLCGSPRSAVGQRGYKVMKALEEIRGQVGEQLFPLGTETSPKQARWRLSTP